MKLGKRLPCLLSFWKWENVTFDIAQCLQTVKKLTQGLQKWLFWLPFCFREEFFSGDFFSCSPNKLCEDEYIFLLWIGWKSNEVSMEIEIVCVCWFLIKSRIFLAHLRPLLKHSPHNLIYKIGTQKNCFIFLIWHNFQSVDLTKTDVLKIGMYDILNSYS